MSLREVVEKYRGLAQGYGRAVPLADFGLSREETERLFGGLDEDYHISRFFHFTLDPEFEKTPGRSYNINGFPQSHVSLDENILEIL